MRLHRSWHAANHPQLRTEHHLLGQREVPVAAYYGVQALRGLENFRISGVPLSEPKNRRRH
jgi:aspartate ammonia-lyase